MRYPEMVKQKATSPPAEKYADHVSLVAAICAGDEEEAIRLLGLHVAQNWKPTRSRIEEFLKDSG